jgi:hypothetical protein
MFKRNFFLYLLILVASISLLFAFYYCQYEELFKDFLIGVVSAIILLIIIEYRDYRRDIHQLGYLKGKYKREARYNENRDKTVDTKWALVESKDDPNIELIYKGKGEYEIPRINYDVQWFAKASIFLGQSNRKYGEGTYHYSVKADSIPVDFGTYQLFVDEFDNRRLYLFHQNYLPSGLSKGYEVFVRCD